MALVWTRREKDFWVAHSGKIYVGYVKLEAAVMPGLTGDAYSWEIMALWGRPSGQCGRASTARRSLRRHWRAWRLAAGLFDYNVNKGGA